MNNPFEIEESNNTLVRIDEFEDKIKQINELTNQYNKLKSDIKLEMLKVGKEKGLNQIKWITPKGIKITCSIGQKAEFEEVTEKVFDMEKLMQEYPEVYKECLKEHTSNVCIKNASNDRLVITLPKEEK